VKSWIWSSHWTPTTEKEGEIGPHNPALTVMSKRKCDRKRPCQRCIQLGLTGLCVYEIDDPALRDDPTLDESTRLRNRIAELESLVRELRGKPHPRWAEGNFRDGDQSERWHSRAQKYSPQAKRCAEPESVDDLPDAQIPSIKTEPRSENNHSPLYGFASPSPGSTMRYNNIQSGVPSPPIFPYDDRRQSYDSGSPRGASAMSYPTSAIAYHHQHHHPDSSSTYSNSSGGYDQSEFEDDRAYSQRFTATSSPVQQYCPCRTNPGSSHVLMSLTHHLQSATNNLRQYPQHTLDSPCILYRRIAELNHLMLGGNTRGHAGSTSTYGAGALPTPTDSEIMSPLSSTSSPYDPPSAGHHGQEWAAIAAAGYNPYFPLQSGETMYNN